MGLNKHPKTLLVIVAEGAIERSLVRDAQQLGAHGWTVTEVRGAGRAGVREGAWEADRTVEIKFICAEAVADAIAEHVLDQYAPHYKVVMYFCPVEVLRPDRF